MSLPTVNPTEPEDNPPTLAQDQGLQRRQSYLGPILWRGKIGPAFWNIASLLSLAINVILIVTLILLGRELFSLKAVIQKQLVGGLYTNFVEMDQSHIVTTINVKDTIQVNDTIPVVFDLPLKKDTDVILTHDTPVKNATIYLNGQPVPLDLVLKKGTHLGIALDLTVPVSQTLPISLKVPVNLTVPVDIALDQTDLHKPFVGLQNVVSPYKNLLSSLPDSWYQTSICGPFTLWLCDLLSGDK